MEKKETPVISKANEQKPPVKKQLNVPKPMSKERKGVTSVSKRHDVSARVNSRGSARSNEKRSSSKTRVEDKKDDAPNKYINFAEKNCPSYDKETL